MANRKKTRVLIATGIYPPDIGGPATYSKLLFDELPKKGFSVRVLSFGEVRRFPKVVRHFLYFFKLFLKAFKSDFIFAQDAVSVGFPSLLVSKILNKKFLIRVPGDHAWEQGTQRFGITDSIDDFQNKKYNQKVEFLRKIQKFVVSHADVVIIPSNYFKNLVSGWMKNTNTLHTIYNGVDFESAGTKEDCRDKLGMSDDTIVIVSAGRLVPWKGFDEVISVVSKLQESVLKVKLLILGDGPERENLEALISKKKMENFVTITGNLPRSELLAYLRASDIFILNSNFESFSFQTVEAMYCGTGVIVSRIGSLPELVEDGSSGILFDVNDETAMLKAMKYMIEHPDQKGIMVLHAMQRAQTFSIENTISNLIKFIQ